MSQQIKHVVMVSAENGSLIDGKVGGLADVIRDLPNALDKLGWRTTVITPSYGFLHNVNPSKLIASVTFPFGGGTHRGEIFEVKAKQQKNNVKHLVIENDLIRGNPIYLADPPNQPFARDATKFAMFCSAVGKFILTLGDISVIHLHDWHTGFFLLLTERHPQFANLKKNRIVFTIHNLSYQGSRPMLGDQASVEKWFPEIFTTTDWICDWKDHRYTTPIFTPLIAGITKSDMVNTVSPTYAQEIQKPSNPEKGFHGGEGLEKILQEINQQHRLVGILNGIEYPENKIIKKKTFNEILNTILGEVNKYNETHSSPISENVYNQIEYMRKHPADLIITSVTRISEQKVRLLFEKGKSDKIALEKILQLLKKYNGYFILIGNGDAKYEQMLEQCAAKNKNLLYLKLYSDVIAETLYKNGTIFMMPSLFEPCGITQLIAMREGQPCIVHATGGLKDTVIDGVTGFHFKGETIPEIVNNLISVTEKVLAIYSSNKEQWKKICAEAAKVRFDWDSSARRYIKEVYTPL